MSESQKPKEPKPIDPKPINPLKIQYGLDSPGMEKPVSFEEAAGQEFRQEADGFSAEEIERAVIAEVEKNKASGGGKA